MVAGEEPISFTITGLTITNRIKRVGIVFENSVTSWFNIARVEFTNNVKVFLTLADANTPWEAQDNGTFLLPRSGHPFIMFAQRPYNTFNFSLVSFFTNTVTGGIAGYPVAVGLVGHAQDASNYTLARYNKVATRAELVLVRDGIETLISYAAPGWALGDLHGIQFKHNDGLFTIDMYREGTAQFEQVLSYSWQSANGYMYTSATLSMKTGIYGYIAAPLAKILGFWSGDSEGVSNADGIPLDPLSSVTDFPATGSIRILDNVYSYTSKVSMPTIPRGPYQFRQMNDYTPPYGTGTGLEARDFDWTASNNLTNGFLIAIDSGANFYCIGALWQTFNSTDGVYNYFYNRARFYSANPQIAKIYHTLSNRVWITGGFRGITLNTGKSMKHSFGDIAILELTGSIVCNWFSGSGGPEDTTVSDLISSICAFSGAKANFPGDYSNTSVTVNGEVLLYRDYYGEGFDCYFEHSAPQSFEIRTNVKIKPDNYDEAIDSDTGTKLVITSLGSGSYKAAILSTPSNIQMYAMLYTSGTTRQKYRLLYHEKNISLYQNGRWITTLATDDLIYDQTTYIDISAYTASSIIFENVRFRELSDWREAIYIDLETDGQSALSSVIQERPIEIYAQPDGILQGDNFIGAVDDCVGCSLSLNSSSNSNISGIDYTNNIVTYKLVPKV